MQPPKLLHFKGTNFSFDLSVMVLLVVVFEFLMGRNKPYVAVPVNEERLDHFGVVFFLLK